MKHTLTLLLGFFLFVGALTTGSRAQSPTIVPVLTMSPNPSPYLSDWQSRREMVTLIATLDRPFHEPVKLMATVSRNGQVVAETKPEKMPFLTLHQGINTFNASDIIPFNAVSFKGGIDQSAQRLGRLPEGQYEICVWFFYGRGGDSFVATESRCQSFAIVDVEPPTLIGPMDGAKYNASIPIQNSAIAPGHEMTLDQLVQLDLAELRELEAVDLVARGGAHTMYQILPFNDGDVSQIESIRLKSVGFGNNVGTDHAWGHIRFQWLPPMPMPSEPVQYRLRVVEVLSGQTAEQALKTTASLIDKDYIPTTYASIIDILTTDIIDLLFPAHAGPTAKQFAWTVQSHDASGKPIGKNSGWAAPHVFEIGDSDFDLLRIDWHDSTKAKPLMINSFFDIFADPIDWVDAKADSLKKLADSLRTKALRLLDKVIDVEKIKEVIKIIGDSLKVVKPKPDPEPCPHVDKKLLRTVVGPWKKISTTVRHITVGKRTVAWADVEWQRDVFNVFVVSHCTLLKGHGGAHKMGPAVEEKVKYGTFTEKMSYGPGIPHAPPKPHATDAVPEE